MKNSISSGNVSLFSNKRFVLNSVGVDSLPVASFHVKFTKSQNAAANTELPKTWTAGF